MSLYFGIVQRVVLCSDKFFWRNYVVFYEIVSFVVDRKFFKGGSIMVILLFASDSIGSLVVSWHYNIKIEKKQ